MEDADRESKKETEISKEDIAAAKTRARIAAFSLALIFLISVLAPPPWSSYAPLLLLIPLAYSLLSRIRRGSEVRQGAPPPPRGVRIPEGPIKEPYSYTPRDPKDPRRYKPIG